MSLTEENSLILDIRANNFEIPSDYTLSQITDILYENIGNTHSDTREAVYYIFCNWIFEGKYSSSELIAMGDLMEKNIIQHLNEENTDFVFTRAFSILVLALLVEYDYMIRIGRAKSKEPYLNQKIMSKWLKSATGYYRQEKDYRGFVQDKGWAHSIAHGADFFYDYSKHLLSTPQDLQSILEMFAKKLKQPCSLIFTAREDKRISIVIYTILARLETPVKDFEVFISSLVEIYREKAWYNLDQNDKINNSGHNIRDLLFSIYFLIKFGINSAPGAHFDWPLFSEKQFESNQKSELLKIIERALIEIDHGSNYLPLSDKIDKA